MVDVKDSLCYTCKHRKFFTDDGKVACKLRGTKRPRTKKCAKKEEE